MKIMHMDQSETLYKGGSVTNDGCLSKQLVWYDQLIRAWTSMCLCY